MRECQHEGMPSRTPEVVAGRASRGCHHVNVLPMSGKIMLPLTAASSGSVALPCDAPVFTEKLGCLSYRKMSSLFPCAARAACPGGPRSLNLIKEEFVMGDHARLMSFLWFAMELAMSSPLFAKLSALFSSDAACLEGLERVRGRGHERLRVVAYRLGGLRYSWAPRFRLAVLLLLRDKFPELVGAIEVVDPTVAPVERRAMEELGCIVTTSPALCLVVEEPTLIFMPYADRVFFENLLILNWSPDKLGKIVVLGHSFSTMVKMLELSISKQEKCGVNEQREKVKRVLAIPSYVQELELCAEISGLFDNPLLGDEYPYELNQYDYNNSPEQCNCATRVGSNVNVQMGYDAQLEGMLGAHECIQLVVYGIGSFEFDVKSQYQIAFALLLKEDNIFPISDIEIYDPSLPPADVKACFDLDLRVLLVNEQCQRSVDKPIIFFVPGLAFVGNLIESNFSPEQLNNIILISYGVKNIGDRISAELENWNNGFTSLKGSPELERERFIWASINYINEVIVMENFNAHFWGVSDMRFEFLDVAADVDMNSNLPKRMSRPFQDDQDDCKDGKPQDWAHEFLHRIPAMHRKTWSPPPKGWIKFNFHGIGGSKDRSAGMGGVFHNEDGVLSFFIGSLGNVDQTVASIGAIELGLKVMLEYHEPVKKLIVEGDDLTVIRWFNRVSHPPARAHDSFLRSYLHLTSMPLPCEGAAVPAEISKDPDHENGSSSHDASPTKPPNDGNIENDASPAKQFEREYIAWRVDEEANQVAIGLARLGSMLPDHQNRVKLLFLFCALALFESIASHLSFHGPSLPQPISRDSCSRGILVRLGRNNFSIVSFQD
ncbi:Os04g0589000 [Oryza sativa Japonica Group]|uniref:Os04g0589000 protein n=1 Tax=Oryza sativa subsp. japonica TaxID=39947 RepID=A0A0P0WE06_ORYSJ|nr:Os04g0589000 [Oryza sativa Japonica Group]